MQNDFNSLERWLHFYIDIMQVNCNSIVKTYPDGAQALKGVDLQLEEGLFGLLGPNGAGKTTLMEIMTLLLEPTAGDLWINGVNSKKHPMKIRQWLGYLPQNFGVYPELTAKEFLMYLAHLRGLSHRESKEQVSQMLSLVRLTHVQNKRLKTYSGGMLRRVGIAQALLGNPKFIIVDEPTAGLDPEERVHFRNLLFELREGRVVVLSTHIVKDIEDTCTQMALLHDGVIRFQGSPSHFVHAARGQTWEFYGSPDDLEYYSKKPSLVSIREDEHGICFRLVSEHSPRDGAREVIPNLEDAYVRFLETDRNAA